jgi:hypothetical protein
MSPEQIREKLPPPLQGPRIEADTPHIRTELVCVCGNPLESVSYIYCGVIRHVVHPCPCYQKVKK